MNLALHLQWQAPASPSWKPSLGWSCYAAQAALGGKGVGAHGTLRFAAPSSFAQLHIMPLLPDFQTLFPDLTLDLRLSDTSFDANEGSFDLAL